MVLEEGKAVRNEGGACCWAEEGGFEVDVDESTRDELGWLSDCEDGWGAGPRTMTRPPSFSSVKTRVSAIAISVDRGRLTFAFWFCRRA